jgi:uncharacterized protein (DUF885 family)
VPEEFDGLLERFLAEELDESPVLGTSLGIDGYDDRLGDYSATGFARRQTHDLRWLERFQSFSEPLTNDERIDRDLVVSSLRGRAVLHDWANWQRDAELYLGPGLTGVFLLFLYRLAPEHELASFAAARLRAVPEVLDHGRANLNADLVSPVLLDRARGQCRAAIRYARELLPAEVAEGESRSLLSEAGDVAATAYESFGRFLDDLAPRAHGPFAIGEARYSALLSERELLTSSAAELRDRGAQVYDEVRVSMDDLSEHVVGQRSWKHALSQLSAEHPRTPEEMRAGYEEWTERARDFLVEHGLVSMPDGERCSVEPSPPFQRPVLAVASYNRPPPFRASLTGHFFVPFPPDGTPADEIQQRLATNAWYAIPAISVHEAYPGHHWHLVTAQATHRPIRKVLRSTYFAEGWALYAELMMREQGFFADPRHEMGQLDNRLFRAARIVVDTSLHSGEMTFDDAVTFMLERTSLSEPTARAEVGRYCAWPTQASSYLTGSLEIERLRDQWFAENRGDLRTFHDQLAGAGCMPVPLHAAALAL